jgi:ribosomal protein S4
MAGKIIKGFNIKKYKVYHQTKLNLNPRLNIGHKLKKEKWSFFKFNNEFKFFPKIKTTKLKFFFSNILNIRRVLSSQHCRINSKTLKKLYWQANKGHPKQLHFLNALESRLDVCLHRTGFFKTPFQLRQFICHGNIYLNGYLVTKPGIQLNKNDLVQIDFSNLSHFRLPCDESLRLIHHLEISKSTFSFIYLGFFKKDQIPYLDKTYSSFLTYTFRR